MKWVREMALFSFIFDSSSNKTRAVAYPGFHDYVETVTGSAKTVFQLDITIDADHVIDVDVDGRNQPIENTHWSRNTGLAQITTTSAVNIGSVFKARIYLK